MEHCLAVIFKLETRRNNDINFPSDLILLLDLNFLIDHSGRNMKFEENGKEVDDINYTSVTFASCFRNDLLQFFFIS